MTLRTKTELICIIQAFFYDKKSKINHAHRSMGKKYLFRLGSKKNSDANGLSKTINSTRVNNKKLRTDIKREVGVL